MTSKDFEDMDMDRYLNDPEYRREMARRKKVPGGSDMHAGSVSGKGKSSKREEKTYSSRGSSSEIGWRHILGAFGGLIIAGFIGGLLFFFYLNQGLPSIEELENPQTDIASFVVSRDGQVLDKYFTENRTYIDIRISRQMSLTLWWQPKTTGSTRTGALTCTARWPSPTTCIRGNPQGGSTISQQLARNLYRSIGREVSVTRKLREIITAIQIEQNYTKQEIIEMYLNTVEFSNSAFGIETAAHTHFNKPASDLTVPKRPPLSAVFRPYPLSIHAPARNDPCTEEMSSLSQMMRHGFITSEEFAQYRATPLELDYNPPFRAGRESRYFGQYVRQQIQGWATDNGYDLYRDGLVIHTTIDSRMQRYAEEALKSQLERHQLSFEQEWTTPGSNRYMDRLWAQYPDS
jgi:penicillin-binding protein 1A